jgi:kynurenine 3-monooxygenase
MPVVVVGAGLAGTLLAIFLARRGCQVEVFEQQADPRRLQRGSGRSINLTLCERGLTALDRAGVGRAVREQVVPVRGRLLHRLGEEPRFLAYGPIGEALHAIARNTLCCLLLDEAVRVPGIRFHFEQRCTNVELKPISLEFTHTVSGERTTRRDCMFVGADGAFSAVRLRLIQQYNFNYSQEYSSSAYIELPIVPAHTNGWTAHHEMLHVWPRTRSMLLAIPNRDRTFTGTLLLPFRGPTSHQSIVSESDLLAFMSERFSDAMDHIPNLAETYFSARPIPLVTMRCSPWNHGGQILLIGDAAHAVFPSYGQGANAGFEDCAALDECFAECGGDWEQICERFEERRRPHTDVMAELSKQHLADLQDAMGREDFELRARLETRLTELSAGKYRSLYGLISFTGIPYADAVRLDASRRGLVEELLALPQVKQAIDTPEAGRLIQACALRYGIAAKEGS